MSPPLWEVEMYVPPHFREDRLPVLHEAILKSGLATLVTIGHDGLEANPQGRGSAADTPALAIFLGPDFYVTPSWYAKKLTGKVVPTWDYVAVPCPRPAEVL